MSPLLINNRAGESGDPRVGARNINCVRGAIDGINKTRDNVNIGFKKKKRKKKKYRGRRKDWTSLKIRKSPLGYRWMEILYVKYAV